MRPCRETIRPIQRRQDRAASARDILLATDKAQPRRTKAARLQPSSVPVDRRMRRAKSDGIDAELLLRTLLAWLRGEPRVCSMVPVPDEADEDARRCVRERTELISERIGLTNRIGAVLATLGVSDYNPLLRNRYRRLAELRTGLGEPLPANAHAKIKRLLARLELVLTQIAELERERDAVMETEASDKASRMIQQLAGLRGIGVQSATVLVREAFVRRFANGKALGSYAGLGYGTARVAPAEHGVAHAVEEAALLRGLLSAQLGLQLLDARIGALERLVHDQHRLHQRIDCMWRPSHAIGDDALGVPVAGVILQSGQTIEQFVHQLSLLRCHAAPPGDRIRRLCGLPDGVTAVGTVVIGSCHPGTALQLKWASSRPQAAGADAGRHPDQARALSTRC